MGIKGIIAAQVPVYANRAPNSSRKVAWEYKHARISGNVAGMV